MNRLVRSTRVAAALVPASPMMRSPPRARHPSVGDVVGPIVDADHPDDPPTRARPNVCRCIRRLLLDRNMMVDVDALGQTGPPPLPNTRYLP